jgi:hypothetical protein
VARRAFVVSLPLVLACTRGEPVRAVPPLPRLQVDATSLAAAGQHAGADTPSHADAPPLERDEIRMVVRTKLPQVRACFELGLAEQPTLTGRVALRFTIDAMGRVREPSVADDELGLAPVTACLLDELATWQFPLPAAGRPLTIVYPFRFTAEAALRAAALPRVEGTLQPEAVAEPFVAGRDELDACLRDAELAAGSLGVAFTIDDAGTVTKIASYSSSLPESTTRCLLRTISSWRFPAAAPGDLVTVNHDLVWD